MRAREGERERGREGDRGQQPGKDASARTIATSAPPAMRPAALSPQCYKSNVCAHTRVRYGHTQTGGIASGSPRRSGLVLPTHIDRHTAVERGRPRGEGGKGETKTYVCSVDSAQLHAGASHVLLVATSLRIVMYTLVTTRSQDPCTHKHALTHRQ
jgi:hypothetical protein